jgi:hypothetical protein
MLVAFDCVRLDGQRHQYVPDDVKLETLDSRVINALYTFTLGRPSRLQYLGLLRAEAAEHHSITSSCVSIKARKEDHE